MAQALIQYDVDGAIGAIEEIADADVRRRSIRLVLIKLSDDEEAIRLGSAYGFGREAVLEMRRGNGSANIAHRLPFDS